MGFLHQLHLLLWKNISLKRRGPVSVAVFCPAAALPTDDIWTNSTSARFGLHMFPSGIRIIPQRESGWVLLSRNVYCACARAGEQVAST